MNGASTTLMSGGNMVDWSWLLTSVVFGAQDRIIAPLWMQPSSIRIVHIIGSAL